MGVICVNGVRVEVPDGSSVSVVNNVVYVNGAAWAGGVLQGPEVRFKVEGSLLSLRVDRGSVEVSGDVDGDVQAGTAVRCGNVKGSVQAGTGVDCRDVGGDVRAGTGVNCGKVAGSVRAGTSVRHG